MRCDWCDRPVKGHCDWCVRPLKGSSVERRVRSGALIILCPTCDTERENIVRLIAWTGTGALPPTGKARAADKGREEIR